MLRRCYVFIDEAGPALGRRESVPRDSGLSGLVLEDAAAEALHGLVRVLPTPNAAEAHTVRIYRAAKTSGAAPGERARAALADYRHPVPLDVLQFQMEIAIREATDLSFVPLQFRRQGMESRAAITPRGREADPCTIQDGD